ncbi:Flp pilus assembly complex ATPase component TadA, partial [Patescibacteria group bacterium]|nr:Flp pilus assembly complex ATPase component TadA [Patescibacteria group bacterium]
TDSPAQPVHDSSIITEKIRSVGDVLVKNKALTEKQYDQIKMQSVSTGRGVEELIAASELIEEADLVKAKGEYYKIPFVNLNEVGVAPTAISLVPRPVAENFNLIPFDFNPQENILKVAMVNPLDIPAIKFVEKKAGATVIPYISMPKMIKLAVEERYAQNLATEVKEALKKTSLESTEKKESIDITSLSGVIREAPIAKIVSTILEFAVKARASDVHIEPQERRVRVRYRIDGILHERLVLPVNLHEAIVSRIKILSEMKIDEKRIPQDGRFNFTIDKRTVDLRVSCLPTVHGEKIVMRLLKKGGGVPDLPELGLRGRGLKHVEEAILKPNGIVIVCGPTGSGKTTTLYSAISRINSSRVNIVTLEDPVEYEIGGVNQVQVNRAAGLTFASGLRSFLRQDPNVIMVGEIRDEETVDLAIQAALTGHLVFSTIHTRSASGALPRMLDLNAEPFLLASAINCIIGQRVCRRVCKDCKEGYQPSDEEISLIKSILGSLYDDSKKVTLQKGKGCAVCNNTGYLERVGIYEVLAVTEKVGRLILERKPANEIQKVAVEEGMIAMAQDGFLKVIEGITSLEEVKRVVEV